MSRAGAGGRPLVVARDVVVRTPSGSVVLDGVSVSIARERVGVVGVNGVGKTMLARVLAGELEPAGGGVERAGRIGFLPQRVEDAVAGLAAGAVFGRGRAEGFAGGDAAALARMGVGWVDPLTPMSRLSGGERMRVAIAALLARGPDLLILDEPTNNLDAEARGALYALVSSWRGGLLVISHDRRLLGLVDRIIELTPRGAKSYGGSYELYEEQKRAEEAAAAHDVEHAARELRRAERDARAAVERQGRREARGKSARAKGGVPKIVLDMMRDNADRTGARVRGVHAERVEAAAAGLREARGRIDPERKLDIGAGEAGVPEGKVVVSVEDLWFSHGDGGSGARELYSGLSVRIVGPRRVAVTGPNGSGKSTLLRLIAGELPARRGAVRVGVDRCALLDQHAAVLAPGASVLENFVRLNPGVGEGAARSALARFLFRGGEAGRRAGELSGGERLRAALACVVGGPRPAGLLLLDEPGNHLDLESLAQLEGALRGFGGAVVVVSHDEAFLEAVGVDGRVALGGAGGGWGSPAMDAVAGPEKDRSGR